MNRTGSSTGIKPRVFVSSAVEGFGEYREAARRGIEAAGGQAVLANEDFPSLVRSSRNACLDAIDSCDYFISIVGPRGGWTTPSGLLVVEEEYDGARTRHIPVLAFLSKGDRDFDAQRFAQRLSDYVDGTFRRTFATTADLEREVERSLRSLIPGTPVQGMNRRQFRDPLDGLYQLPYTAMLRFVLSPERQEEVIDPVRLESEGFLRRVFEIAHGADVGLLSYEKPKARKMDNGVLRITQTDPDGRHGQGEHVRLELNEAGDVVIDANVSGRVQRGSPYDMLDSMVIAIEDIENILAICFRFAGALYAELDEFKRHQRFVYNVGLSGLENRTLQRNPKPQSSYSMSMRSKAIVVAFDDPRLIDRAALASPQSEIERVTVLLSRKAGE